VGRPGTGRLSAIDGFLAQMTSGAVAPASQTSLSRKVATNAAAIAAGRILLVGTGLVSVAIATRYLGLGAYGALTTAAAFVGVLTPLIDVGLATIGAREIAKRPDDTERLLGTIMTLGLVLAPVVTAGALGATFLIYPGGGNDQVREGIALMLLPLLLWAPVNAASSYFLAQQKAYIAVIASVVGSLLTLTLLVLATLLDWGFPGVVLAYVATGLGYGATMVSFTLGKVRLRPTFDAGLLSQLLRWSLPVGGVLLLSSLHQQLGIILLSLLKPGSQVAFYGLAFKVVTALLVLPFYVLITLAPEYARLADNRRRLDEVVQKAFTAMEVSAAPILVLFVVFAPEITKVAGGSDFDGATPVLQILMPGVAVSFLGAIFGHVLISVNRQKWTLVATLVAVGANVILNLALIPIWGARGAAAAFTASEVAALACGITLFGRVGTVPKPYRVPQVLAAVAVMAGVSMVKLLPFAAAASPLLVLCVGGAASLGAYAACLYAFGAMPRELHMGLVLPVLTTVKLRLRPSMASRL
jgi:O-antigen/teichoic acid export membrane protein